MSKTLGIQVGSLLLLAVTVLASSRAGREIDIRDFPIDLIPARLGEWTWDRSSAPKEAVAGGDSEARRYFRAYRDPQGVIVTAEVKVTSSRIGSLRDYGTVRIGQGWTPEPAAAWEATSPRIPFKVRACSQAFRQGPARLYTLNWYVTPGDQAFTLSQAVLKGWRQRVLGTPLWGQVYLSVQTKQAQPEAQEALATLARELLPSVYGVLCDYATRAPRKQASPSGERT